MTTEEEQLVDMGFSLPEVRAALRRSGNDVQLASEKLLSGDVDVPLVVPGAVRAATASTGTGMGDADMDSVVEQMQGLSIGGVRGGGVVGRLEVGRPYRAAKHRHPVFSALS